MEDDDDDDDVYDEGRFDFDDDDCWIPFDDKGWIDDDESDDATFLFLLRRPMFFLLLTLFLIGEQLIIFSVLFGLNK